MTITLAVDDLPFLGGHTVGAYRDFVAARYPDFAARLDFGREGSAAALAGLPVGSGIRFDVDRPPDLALRDSQRQEAPRATGIRHLLTTAIGRSRRSS